MIMQTQNLIKGSVHCLHIFSGCYLFHFMTSPRNTCVVWSRGALRNAMLFVANNPGMAPLSCFYKELESPSVGLTCSFIVSVSPFSPFLPPPLLAPNIQSPREGNVSQKTEKGVINCIASSGFPVLSKRLQAIPWQTWSKIS